MPALDLRSPLETLRVGGSGAFACASGRLTPNAIACALRLQETRGSRVAGARCESINFSDRQRATDRNTSRLG
jgi:hypothetical protein